VQDVDGARQWRLNTQDLVSIGFDLTSFCFHFYILNYGTWREGLRPPFVVMFYSSPHKGKYTVSFAGNKDTVN
jgi:hypothetical protein